jgi:hypothetical protein
MNDVCADYIFTDILNDNWYDFFSYFFSNPSSLLGRDRIVVGLTNIYAISANHY